MSALGTVHISMSTGLGFFAKCRNSFFFNERNWTCWASCQEALHIESQSKREDNVSGYASGIFCEVDCDSSAVSML